MTRLKPRCKAELTVKGVDGLTRYRTCQAQASVQRVVKGKPVWFCGEHDPERKQETRQVGEGR